MEQDNQISNEQHMNERIKELAAQASYSTRDELANRELSDDFKEVMFNKKFAELLIAECADTIDTWGDSGRFETFGQRLKARFASEQQS